MKATLLALGLYGCNTAPASPSHQDLLDPEQCVSCHPAHVSQWRSSTHASASQDPVFQAMNARYIRETGDADPTFCVRCHAPMAVQLGALTDPTALDGLPEGTAGVGCLWCHGVEAVTGSHNAPLVVAEDTTMRGGIADPVPNPAHESSWSHLLDRDSPDASRTCGACHDVVLPGGLHIERTYAEWQHSVFDTTGPARLGCGHCHMPGTVAQAAADGPQRIVHDHTMPGISLRGDDPDQRAAVQRALDGSVQTTICVAPWSAGTEVTVILENVGAGHGFPSGSTKNRRAWLEVVATADDIELLRSGTFADDEPVQEEDELAALHDLAWDADGAPAAMLWDVDAFASRALPAPVTLDPRDPAYDHSRRFTWRLSGVAPERVEARLLIRPLALSILDDLVQSGDLAPALATTNTLVVGGTAVVWQGTPGECTD